MVQRLLREWLAGGVAVPLIVPVRLTFRRVAHREHGDLFDGEAHYGLVDRLWETRPIGSLVNRQSYIELGVAIGRGIVRDGSGHVAALDRKLQRFLWQSRQPRDAGFAIAIGADFDLRRALAPKAVFDPEINLGIKKWFA